MEFETEQRDDTSAGSALVSAQCYFPFCHVSFKGLNSLWEIRHLNLELIPKLIFKVLCSFNVLSYTEGGFIRKFQVVFLLPPLILSL